MNYIVQPRISVIIPVFNVACFLKQCIVSVINQTISDLQIILIDDGSTDTSGEICEEFAKKDKRIKVIHQENLGVSAARNSGLQEATGTYISFVDADDILPERAYENLLKDMSIQPQLIMGQMQRINEQGKVIDKSKAFNTKIMEKDEFLIELFEEKHFSYLGFLGDKLFIREVIEKYELSFKSLIAVNEDRLFLLQYMLKMQKVQIDYHVVYYYRQRSSGVIATTRSSSTVTDSEMTVVNSFKEMQKICWEYSKKLYFVCSRKAFECGIDLLQRVSKSDRLKRNILRGFLYESGCICLKDPQYGWKDKIKIIGHILLEK